MAFVPKKKTSVKDTIKNYLMQGFIARADSRDEKPIEIMGREKIGSLSTMRNIGLEQDVMHNITCDRDTFREVIDELKEEYSVLEVSCGGSGCCQYHTNGYYIEGEFSVEDTPAKKVALLVHCIDNFNEEYAYVIVADDLNLAVERYKKDRERSTEVLDYEVYDAHVA